MRPRHPATSAQPGGSCQPEPGSQPQPNNHKTRGQTLTTRRPGQRHSHRLKQSSRSTSDNEPPWATPTPATAPHQEGGYHHYAWTGGGGEAGGQRKHEGGGGMRGKRYKACPNDLPQPKLWEGMRRGCHPRGKRASNPSPARDMARFTHTCNRDNPTEQPRQPSQQPVASSSGGWDKDPVLRQCPPSSRLAQMTTDI